MLTFDKVAEVIHEKTAIPIGFGVILGYIIIWAVHLGDTVGAHAISLEKMKEKQRTYNEDMLKIKNSLHHIEWALHIKPNKDEE